MHVRRERPGDNAGIRAVHIEAFGGSTEADLVDALGDQASPLVSLVADEDGRIVGHILFSPVTLNDRPELALMGLAPMAVMPTQQRRGIGGALVREGLVQCRCIGAGAVVVIGHADYYPRFGFAPASRFGLRSEYAVADEVFMVLELVAGVMSGKSGTIRYHPAFAG
jgi:putative acetyltransferase